MSDTEKKSPISTASQLETLRTELNAVAATANADDKKTVGQILAAAKEGKKKIDVLTLTPPVMAILHTRHNPHNRDVNVPWVRELARRMSEGQWCWNNELPGFYDSGEMSDGGHRCAAGAIAGYAWQTAIVYGVHKEAITTIDDGKRRHASDAAKLGGIASAVLKETVLRQATAYMVKQGADVPVARSITEMATALREKTTILDTAIEVGRASVANMVNPVLKDTVAVVVAYLMLTHGWPEQRVREKLALFNQGNASVVGENDPFFVAAETISNARKKVDIKDRLSTNKEIGVVLQAMTMTAQGVRAVRKGQLLANLKKGLPDPTYPGEPEPTAQAA